MNIKPEEQNNTPLSEKPSTDIFLEESDEGNPYAVKRSYVCGYPLEQVISKLSFSETLLLLFRQEIPQKKDAQILELLFNFLACISPRHPAARASMSAGISKSNTENILPIAMMALGGKRGGAVEVELCYRFIEQNIDKDVVGLADNLLQNKTAGKERVAAGFGSSFGGVDQLVLDFSYQLLNLVDDISTVAWVCKLAEQFHPHSIGLLDVGIAAAIFKQLNIGARESVGLYQLLRAPGVLALGMEQTHKPISAVPMLKDEQYELVK